MGAQIKVEGSTLHARRQLRLLEERVDRPERAWKEVGSYLSREVRKQFATRGANFGTPWRPLAPSTVRQKLRAGYSRQMLVRTGAMKRQFTGRPMDLEVYAGKTATFGSRGNLAKWQSGGTYRNGRRHIPPRPILVMTPAVRREIRKIMREWIVRGK